MLMTIVFRERRNDFGKGVGIKNLHKTGARAPAVRSLKGKESGLLKRRGFGRSEPHAKTEIGLKPRRACQAYSKRSFTLAAPNGLSPAQDSQFWRTLPWLRLLN
jgi:hypothetical protein